MKNQHPPPYNPEMQSPMCMPHDSPIMQEQQNQSPIVVTNNMPVNYGPKPQVCQCPSCHANISSKTRTKATTKTHLIALVLCFCCCWLCACMPYCMDSCQNIDHYCPHCGTYLGCYES